MKISGSFLAMLLIWLLGFTHFLGGPFIFFKVIFWIILLPYIITTFFLILMILKTKKFIKRVGKSQNQETLHVESEVINE